VNAFFNFIRSLLSKTKPLGPLNYDSINIVDDVIEYTALGRTTLIHLSEVTSVKFVRAEALFEDLYGPYIETSWWIKVADEPYFEMMDEPPHRQILLETFIKQLRHFDDTAATAAFNATNEGQWICFDRSKNLGATD
jgi:hypothetical protein